MAFANAEPLFVYKHRDAANTLIGLEVSALVYDDTYANTWVYSEYISGNLLQRILDHPNRANSKLEARMVIKERILATHQHWLRVKADEIAAALETRSLANTENEIGNTSITNSD